MSKIFILMPLIIFILLFTLMNCPSKSNYDSGENIVNSENIIDQNEIQDKINSANDGDTVEIPSGTLNLSSRLTINAQITLKGAGYENTILVKKTDGEMIYINLDDKPFRITGISLDGNNEARGIEIRGDPKNFRIDNSKFQNCNRAIVTNNYSYGVIDHNIFIDNYPTDVTVWGDDADSWARESTYISKYGDNLGHPEFVFIENNKFYYTGEGEYAQHSVASNHGARYVFRYNEINAVYITDQFHFTAPIDVHGNFSYGRGTVVFEIYNNTINSQHSFRGIHIRGGTGVIYDNTFNGDFTYAIHLNNYRSWDTPDGETPGGCPIGSYDPYYCSGDYPCIDQINDLYIWGNTYNGSTVSAEVDDKGYNTTHIQEGRDYYNYERSYTRYQYPHPLVTD